MHINFKIENDVLKIRTDIDGQNELKAMPEEEIQSDDALYDAFEGITCNGLTWVRPEDIGALTNGPILSDDCQDDDGTFPKDAKFYWYSGYMLKSPLCDLRDNGEVIFTQN